MTGIFISYRREDTAPWAGRVYERLAQDFRRDQIFMDVDNIAPGLDFVRELERHVGSCDVLLAIMGKGWSDARNANGDRRLDDPRDFVRIELETALKRDIRIIPVLVDGATLPAREELPEELQPLVHRNGIELTHVRFGSDVQRLVTTLAPVIKHPWFGRSRAVSAHSRSTTESRHLVGVDAHDGPSRGALTISAALAMFVATVWLLIALAPTLLAWDLTYGDLSQPPSLLATLLYKAMPAIESNVTLFLACALTAGSCVYIVSELGGEILRVISLAGREKPVLGLACAATILAALLLFGVTNRGVVLEWLKPLMPESAALTVVSSLDTDAGAAAFLILMIAAVYHWERWLGLRGMRGAQKALSLFFASGAALYAGWVAYVNNFENPMGIADPMYWRGTAASLLLFVVSGYSFRHWYRLRTNRR